MHRYAVFAPLTSSVNVVFIFPLSLTCAIHLLFILPIRLFLLCSIISSILYIHPSHLLLTSLSFTCFLHFNSTHITLFYTCLPPFTVCDIAGSDGARIHMVHSNTHIPH